jgi:Domain of unknown function (DUF4404)
MDDQDLRKLLKKLHNEIEQTKTVDEKGKKLLQELGKDIQQLLGRSEQASIRPEPSTTESLQTAIDHFEVTHPTLTTALSDLLTALSNAGI